jgi:hypothetical protein
MIITSLNTALLNLLLPRTLLNNNPLLLRLRPSRLLDLNNLVENLSRKSVMTTINSFVCFLCFPFHFIFSITSFQHIFYSLLLHEIYIFIFHTQPDFFIHIQHWFNFWSHLAPHSIPLFTKFKIPKTENPNQITLVRWQTINKIK